MANATKSYWRSDVLLWEYMCCKSICELCLRGCFKVDQYVVNATGKVQQSGTLQRGVLVKLTSHMINIILWDTRGAALIILFLVFRDTGSLLYDPEVEVLFFLIRFFGLGRRQESWTRASRKAL